MTDEIKGGNIIDFATVKQKIELQVKDTNPPEKAENLERLQRCAGKIIDALREENCAMVSVPRMEHLGSGIFRMLGDLVLQAK